MNSRLLKKTTRELLESAVRERVIGYVAGGLGIVAGLAWNEAIRSLIDLVVPKEINAIWAKFAYAVAATFIVTIITFYLTRFIKGNGSK